MTALSHDHRAWRPMPSMPGGKTPARARRISGLLFAHFSRLVVVRGRLRVSRSAPIQIRTKPKQRSGASRRYPLTPRSEAYVSAESPATPIPRRKSLSPTRRTTPRRAVSSRSFAFSVDCRAMRPSSLFRLTNRRPRVRQNSRTWTRYQADGFRP